MSLSETYGPDRFGLSFELYPPKTSAGERALFDHLALLVKFRPAYVTCTYGAGGSTQTKTLDIIQNVKQRFGIPVASHLTCVGATVDQLRDYLSTARDRGVDHIVALRGDPPQGQDGFQVVDGGLRYANELVALLRAEFPDFGVAVAGYPEKHIEAVSLDIDLENLKRKVEAGADIVITQLFYNNDDFFRFRDRCDQIGIRVPIVPGILPVTNLAQVRRITAMCGANLPAEFVASLEECKDAPSQVQAGVAFATAQVEALVTHGVPGVHFYVLNKSQAASKVLDAVSLPPRATP
jgi:methylenetetrahydrofolate reductase (NADPH)